MKAVVVLLALILPGLALAGAAPAERARAAIELLDAAMADLDKAQSARDRVGALTDTIIALEEGLTSLRSGLRQANAQAAALSTALQARDEETGALLAVLMQIGDTSSPVGLVHPGGPLGSARAGMLLSEMVPALDAQATNLRQDLEALTALKTVQLAAEEQLSAGLLAVQEARSALSTAVADRAALPKRFVNDPVREAILLSSAETLADFAAGLDLVTAERVSLVPENMSAEKGELPLPVAGVVTLRAGERDKAGVARPGIVVQTAPHAIVTSPVAATLRYVGTLLDLGRVVILEPQADVLLVLSGLETVYGSAGDVVEAGAPLGLMGGEDHKNAAELSTDGDDTGAGRRETLYIEVRQDNTPEDPSLWFRVNKDG